MNWHVWSNDAQLQPSRQRPYQMHANYSCSTSTQLFILLDHIRFLLRGQEDLISFSYWACGIWDFSSLTYSFEIPRGKLCRTNLQSSSLLVDVFKQKFRISPAERSVVKSVHKLLVQANRLSNQFSFSISTICLTKYNEKLEENTRKLKRWVFVEKLETQNSNAANLFNRSHQGPLMIEKKKRHGKNHKNLFLKYSRGLSVVKMYEQTLRVLTNIYEWLILKENKLNSKK